MAPTLLLDFVQTQHTMPWIQNIFLHIRDIFVTSVHWKKQLQHSLALSSQATLVQGAMYRFAVNNKFLVLWYLSRAPSAHPDPAYTFFLPDVREERRLKCKVCRLSHMFRLPTGDKNNFRQGSIFLFQSPLEHTRNYIVVSEESMLRLLSINLF